jgi:hypothetical protein
MLGAVIQAHAGRRQACVRCRMARAAAGTAPSAARNGAQPSLHTPRTCQGAYMYNMNRSFHDTCVGSTSGSSLPAPGSSASGSSPAAASSELRRTWAGNRSHVAWATGHTWLGQLPHMAGTEVTRSWATGHTCLGQRSHVAGSEARVTMSEAVGTARAQAAHAWRRRRVGDSLGRSGTASPARRASIPASPSIHSSISFHPFIHPSLTGAADAARVGEPSPLGRRCRREQHEADRAALRVLWGEKQRAGFGPRGKVADVPHGTPGARKARAQPWQRLWLWQGIGA